MSKIKDTQNGTTLLNEQQGGDKLDAIRAILMGEQIQSTDSRMQQLQANIQALSSDLEKAEHKFSDRLLALEQAFAKKTADMQAILENRIAQTAKTAEERSTAERQQLGQFLIELGTKLKA